MKITICGSLRFEDEIQKWHEALALNGHIPYCMVVYPFMKGNNKDWYTPQQKMMLDLVHLGKIENSDAILVVDLPLDCFKSRQDFPSMISCTYNVNCEPYIGESTRREIEWAYMNMKEVYFASEHWKWLSENYNTYSLKDDTRDMWINTDRLMFLEMFPHE